MTPEIEDGNTRTGRGLTGLVGIAGIALVVLIWFVATRDSGEIPQAVPPLGSDQPTSTTAAPDDSADQPADPAPDEPADSGEAAASFARAISIEVWVVDNGATDTIQRLTPTEFTKKTGVIVEFVDIPRQEFRERLPSILRGSERADVVMIGSFEAAQFGAVNGWLHDLTSFAEDDPQYAFDDIIASVASVNSAERAFTNLIPVERLYVVPFFAETSVLMYNQAIIDAAGVTVPEQPTWDEIAQIAELVHTDEVAGICLNGSVGWDELGASLTTVVNTFGGTWWEANEDGTPGQAQINQPDSGFRAATETYVDLLRNFGQEDPGSDQCLQIMQDGGAAMWFGSSTSAQQLNQEGLAGNLGVARAPVGPAGLPGGGLSSWGFALPIGGDDDKITYAREFVSWATSDDFISLVGETDGWENAPGGTRLSTYENPDYQAANSTLADVTLDELLSVDPLNPGTTTRPGLPGVEFVGIPEFQDIATQCTIEISAAIWGELTTDQALEACQEIASEVTQPDE